MFEFPLDKHIIFTYNIFSQCHHDGIIPGALRVIGQILNFTVQHHHQSITRLGTAPVEFPANASGKWGGLFGEVFAAKYQMSISYWNNRYSG